MNKEEIEKIVKEQGRNPNTFEPVNWTCDECGKTFVIDKWEASIAEQDLVNTRYVCEDCYKKFNGGNYE